MNSLLYIFIHVNHRTYDEKLADSGRIPVICSVTLGDNVVPRMPHAQYGRSPRLTPTRCARHIKWQSNLLTRSARAQRGKPSSLLNAVSVRISRLRGCVCVCVSLCRQASSTRSSLWRVCVCVCMRKASIIYVQHTSMGKRSNAIVGCVACGRHGGEQ